MASQVLTLAGANSCTGPTLVGTGTLLLTGSLGCQCGDGQQRRNAGRQRRDRGPVAMLAGSTLRPGTVGPGAVTLTISNGLSLAGTAVMAVNRTNAQASAQITGLNAVSYGGALVLTNLGPALQFGDSFVLVLSRGLHQRVCDSHFAAVRHRPGMGCFPTGYQWDRGGGEQSAAKHYGTTTEPDRERWQSGGLQRHGSRLGAALVSVAEERDEYCRGNDYCLRHRQRGRGDAGTYAVTSPTLLGAQAAATPP